MNIPKTPILAEETPTSKKEEAEYSVETQLRAVLDALPVCIALLDRNGRLVAVNRNWAESLRKCGGCRWLSARVGVDYPAACHAAEDQGDRNAGKIARGLDWVLAGIEPRFTLEYACSFLSGRPHRHLLSVTALPRGAVVAHVDVATPWPLQAGVPEHAEQRSWAAYPDRVNEAAADLAHELTPPLLAALQHGHVVSHALAASKSMPADVRYALEAMMAELRHARGILDELKACVHDPEATPRVRADTGSGWSQPVRESVQDLQNDAIDFLETSFPRPLRPERSRATLAGEIQRRCGRLTPREHEILTLIVSGKSSKQIGQELAISPRTVDAHRAHLMEKMRAASLAELGLMYSLCETPVQDGALPGPVG